MIKIFEALKFKINSSLMKKILLHPQNSKNTHVFLKNIKDQSDGDLVSFLDELELRIEMWLRFLGVKKNHLDANIKNLDHIIDHVNSSRDLSDHEKKRVIDFISVVSEKIKNL